MVNELYAEARFLTTLFFLALSGVSVTAGPTGVSSSSPFPVGSARTRGTFDFLWSATVDLLAELLVLLAVVTVDISTSTTSTADEDAGSPGAATDLLLLLSLCTLLSGWGKCWEHSALHLAEARRVFLGNS